MTKIDRVVFVTLTLALFIVIVAVLAGCQMPLRSLGQMPDKAFYLNF